MFMHAHGFLIANKTMYWLFANLVCCCAPCFPCTLLAFVMKNSWWNWRPSFVTFFIAAGISSYKMWNHALLQLCIMLQMRLMNLCFQCVRSCVLLEVGFTKVNQTSLPTEPICRSEIQKEMKSSLDIGHHVTRISELEGELYAEASLQDKPMAPGPRDVELRTPLRKPRYNQVLHCFTEVKGCWSELDYLNWRDTFQ